jgi:hypothetical protein
MPGAEIGDLLKEPRHRLFVFGEATPAGII